MSSIDLGQLPKLKRHKITCIVNLIDMYDEVFHDFTPRTDQNSLQRLTNKQLDELFEQIHHHVSNNSAESFSSNNNNESTSKKPLTRSTTNRKQKRPNSSSSTSVDTSISKRNKITKPSTLLEEVSAQTLHKSNS